jgi:hypothetical protein
MAGAGFLTILGAVFFSAIAGVFGSWVMSKIMGPL